MVFIKDNIMRAKVGLFSDHGGYTLKQDLLNCASEYNFVDYGTNSADAVDYPDFANQAAQCLKDKTIQKAILICGTGIGICMAANRHAWVRAFVAHNITEVKLAREHNDANTICFSGRYQTLDEVKIFIDTFLKTPFEGGRHARRVDIFSKI